MACAKQMCPRPARVPSCLLRWMGGMGWVWDGMAWE